MSDSSEFETTVSRTVIKLETNDARFEDFAREVVSALEGGAQIFSTSRTWDLGRDGVGAGRSKGLYVCTSLRDDVDGKALSDISRITSTTKDIKHLYFCSSQELSEHRRTQIESALAAEVESKFPITCLGAAQLVEAAQRRAPQLISRKYGAEIKNVLRAIQPDENDETEIRGLRLALISAGADDSRAIRSEVYASGILDILADGIPRTIPVCSRDLSGSLGLQRNIATDAIGPHLYGLETRGLITSDKNVYRITESGLKEFTTLKGQAAERLLSGRQAVRDALEASLGTRLIHDHYARIWTVFEDRLAHYFSARGAALVAEIGELLNEAKDASAAESAVSPLSFLDELGEAVARTSSNEQQREELRVAVRDLFVDRTSAATEWLVRVCASFMAACALGLEHSCNVALSKLLARTTLVLDSDVVLSLAGQGEPEHEAVYTIVTRWKRFGGRVLLAEPVMEEVAYHAHIAQSDYNGVANRLPGSAEDRLHLIENVFVRSFAELMARREAYQSQWQTYIRQYKGSTNRDWAPAYSTLSGEFSLEMLPQRSTREAELEDKVRQFLVKQAETKINGDNLKNAKDKANRDAQLYAALVSYLKLLKQSDPGATCLLVSSARRLALAENQFKTSGEPQLVISIASVLYMISLLPDVSLGISSMKAFLFDERRRGLTSGLERTLIRLVRSSGKYSMPWAKRGILMRTVREGLLREADQSGERKIKTDAEIEQDALAPANATRTMGILQDALDATATETRTEIENSKLRNRVKELEDQIRALQQKPHRR